MEVFREHYIETQKAISRKADAAAAAKINRNRRRDEWLATNGPCAICKSTYELEIDHVDPELKLIEASDALRLPSDHPARIAELAKCQVLCAECHNAKTGKDNKRRFPEGPRIHIGKPKPTESHAARRLRRFRIAADEAMAAAAGQSVPSEVSL